MKINKYNATLNLIAAEDSFLVSIREVFKMNPDQNYIYQDRNEQWMKC